MTMSSHDRVPGSTSAQALLVSLLPRRAVEVLSRLKAALRNRRAERSLGPKISEIVPAARSHTLLVANDDAAVFRVEHDRDQTTILKFATSPEACEQVVNETSALSELARLPKMGDWTALIARLEAQGTHDTGTWFRQSVVPGKPTSSVDHDMSELVAAVSDAIAPLHGATQNSLVVDGPLLGDIVHGPLSTIEHWRPKLAAGLSAIGDYLEESLAGRPIVMSRQHGDLAPSNVLWDPTSSTVTGIVDWKLADQLLPPEIDLTHYALSLIALRRRMEYGATVTWLWGEGQHSAEAAAARVAVGAGPNEMSLHCAVTMAWLQHVSFGLHKAVDLRTNPIWVTNNIDNVVHAFKR